MAYRHNVSAELVWPIVRDNSSFAVTRRYAGRSAYGYKQLRLTTEPGNVASKNVFKYSALANAKAVDVTLADDNKTLSLVTKSKKRARTHTPNKANNTVALKKTFKKGAKSIKSVVGASGYRSDLEKAALAKFSLLSRAAKKA